MSAEHIGQVIYQQPDAGTSWPKVVGRLPDRVRHYQHRALTDRIAQAVSESPTVVLGQVLSGMGGVGKTQLATDLVHRMLEDRAVDLVVWVEAASRSSIISTYADAALTVGAANANVITDPEKQAQAFHSWLRTTPHRWLVVLDDVAPPSGDHDAPLGVEYLSDLWPPQTTAGPHQSTASPRLSNCSPGDEETQPPQGRGRTLITTRRKDAALTPGNLTVIDVEVFTTDEATAFLTHALEEHGISNPEEEAAGLASDLGYLPLALAQAAAFIVDDQTDCAAYRRLFADQKRGLDQLVPGPGSLPEGHARTVAATLALSIDHANRLHPAGWARPLLQLLGLLSPEAIPVSVLTAPSLIAHLIKATGAFDGDPADADEEAAQEMVLQTLRVLRRLSLITTTRSLTAESAAVSVHALTQRAARETLAPHQHDAAARAAADALAEAWPEIPRDVLLARALRSCTTELNKHAADALWASEGHRTLFLLGKSLGESGQVAAAVDYWKQLRLEAEQRLGVNHHATLSARNHLAFWTGQTGNDDKAVQMFDELLTDQLDAIGPHNRHTLITRHNLASTTGRAGHPDEAAHLFAELLPDQVEAFGPHDPITLATRNNLAYWTGESGDPAEAAHLFAELLTHQLEAIGPHDPATLATRNNLATCIGEAGHPAEAAHLLAELIPDLVEIRGPHDPYTLTTCNNLATWIGEAGRPDIAVQMFPGILDERRRVLGPNHPDTFATRNNLGNCTGEAGHPDEAFQIFAELIPDQEEALGPHHPHTLVARRSLEYWRSKAAELGDGQKGP